MSNRVEELEAKVSELQAAVNGLTEELVETKERLREIETAQEVEPRAATGNRADNETADSESATEAAESESAHSEILEPSHGGTMGAGPESNDESGAGTDDTETTTESADGDADDIKSEGDDEADDGGSDESDIIVA